VAEAGAAKEDRGLVVYQLAATAGENGWPVGQARPVLLAAVGGEPSDAAAFRGYGAADRGARIVLRSKTPDLVRQEFYGLMMAHFAIRGLMHEAALKAHEDPDRLSFLHAVRVVHRKLPAFSAIPPSAQEGVP
jgi:hypothetical protein